jgi:hypothetical protein
MYKPAMFLVEHFQNISNPVNLSESLGYAADSGPHMPCRLGSGLFQSNDCDTSQHKLRPITKKSDDSSEFGCAMVSSPFGFSFINWPIEEAINYNAVIETNRLHQRVHSNSCKSSVVQFSEDSILSTSPDSSLDSFNSACVKAGFVGDKQTRRELPSKINQISIDTSKCIEKAQQKNANKSICCSFCRNNGEPERIYKSHSLKDMQGRTACPLLKLYKCPICGQTDKDAHTITYCSKYKSGKRSKMLNN